MTSMLRRNFFRLRSLCLYSYLASSNTRRLNILAACRGLTFLKLSISF